MRSALILAVTGAGFALLSISLQTMLAVTTGIDTSGSSLLLPRVENSLLAYGALVVLGQASRYSALYQTRQLHASELEARLAKTHLQLLRMQLQPHFLFNTLNTVAELVHTDPDTADQMITRLGRLLRLSLDHAGHQVVPLRQEIDFLRMYVEIEQVRFQDRLQIVWDLAADTLDAAVPTLLWHPVLENAIRHGVTPLAGRGRIVIASHREGEDLVLEIRDNGKGLPAGGIPREGVGLRNIRERVEQLYGSRARFTLEPAHGRGHHCNAAAPLRRLRRRAHAGAADTTRSGGAGRMTLRVVVADDEPIGRQRLVRLLQAEPDTDVVAACADGEEAVEAIREHAPGSGAARHPDAPPGRLRSGGRAGPGPSARSHLRDRARPVCRQGV